MSRIAPSRSPLLGRDAELSWLGEWLSGTEGPTTVAIAGASGIGKTRLVHLAATLATERGYLPLTGRALELERDVPFGALVDALEERPNGTPRHTLEWVRASLRELSARSRLLLAIDDVHWADPATLRLLTHPHLPNVRVLFAYRPAHAPSSWSRTVEVARRTGHLHVVALEPLGAGDAERLFAPELGADVIRELHRDSGGVPLFLHELAQARRAGRHPAGVADPLAVKEVPRGIRAALAPDLGALSPAARALANAAAVVGDPFAPSVAAQIAELPSEARHAAVEELRHRQLVRPTERHELLAFRQPILRDAIYVATPPGWRLTAHARAAVALADAGGDPVARAPHVERSAKIGDEDAIAVLVAAGETAATGDPALAARWYEAALHLCSPRYHPERRHDLQLALARCLTAAGQAEEAHGIVNEILAALTPDSPVRMSAVVLAAKIAGFIGRHDEAHRHVEETLQRRPESEPDAQVALRLELAGIHYADNDLTAMRTAAQQALGDSRHNGSRKDRIAALGRLATAQWLAGDTPSARRHVVEAATLLNSADDTVAGRALFGLVETAEAELALDRPDHAAEHLHRGLGILEGTGQEIAFVPLVAALVATMTSRGEVAQALPHADELLKRAYRTNNRQTRGRALIASCWTYLQRGDVVAALTMADEAGRIGAELDHRSLAWQAHCIAGAVHIRTGELARGRHWILRAGGEDLADVPPGAQPRWRAFAALAEIGLGRLDAAERHVRGAEAIAHGLQLASRTAEAQRARAALLLATGQSTAAADLAQSASQHFAKAGMRLDAIEAILIGVRATVDAGQHEAAESMLRRAYADAERLGALRLRDEAAHAIRQVGRRVARRSGRSPATPRGALDRLTKRERQVADLIVAGRTNKEIAAITFLSEKTVEKHVSSVLRKLSARSRVQVAATLSELEHDEPRDGDRTGRFTRARPGVTATDSSR